MNTVIIELELGTVFTLTTDDATIYSLVNIPDEGEIDTVVIKAIAFRSGNRWITCDRDVEFCNAYAEVNKLEIV